MSESIDIPINLLLGEGLEESMTLARRELAIIAQTLQGDPMAGKPAESAGRQNFLQRAIPENRTAKEAIVAELAYDLPKLTSTSTPEDARGPAAFSPRAESVHSQDTTTNETPKPLQAHPEPIPSREVSQRVLPRVEFAKEAQALDRRRLQSIGPATPDRQVRQLPARPRSLPRPVEQGDAASQPNTGSAETCKSVSLPKSARDFVRKSEVPRLRFESPVAGRSSRLTSPRQAAPNVGAPAQASSPYERAVLNAGLSLERTGKPGFQSPLEPAGVQAWEPSAPAVERQAVPDERKATADLQARAPGSSGPEAAAPTASDTRRASSATPTEGDVFLDGALVGRWLARHMRREASRPSAGPTGFDPRRGSFYPGVNTGST